MNMEKHFAFLRNLDDVKRVKTATEYCDFRVGSLYHWGVLHITPAESTDFHILIPAGRIPWYWAAGTFLWPWPPCIIPCVILPRASSRPSHQPLGVTHGPREATPEPTNKKGSRSFPTHWGSFNTGKQNTVTQRQHLQVRWFLNALYDMVMCDWENSMEDLTPFIKT